jgi:N-acetylmuramoyl-L-alanine amidase
MRRGATLFMAMLLSVVASTRQGAPPSGPLRLVTHEGTRPIPTVLNGDTELVLLDDLASIFKVVVREDAVARAFTVSYKGKTIVLSQNQALASIAGRLVSLPSPPVHLSDRWYVPVEFIGRAMALIYDTPLELRKASRLVLQGPLTAPRIIVRHDASETQGRVTVDVVPSTPHQVVQEATRLLIRFDADLLDPTIPSIQPQSFVRAIHLGERPTILVVELGPRFGSARAADAPLDPDGTRITLDLFAAPQAAPPPLPSPTGSEPAEPTPPPPPEPAFPTPGVKTIVIDPGHGGDEDGAHGAKGTLEKTIALGVATQMKSALESRLGARVLLTREDDRTVGLDERAALANNNKADLFVSLHANASLRRSASGAEVFYLSLDRADDEARRVAESEGVAMPVFGGGTREINVILWEMAQARHIEQSADLARTIEAELRGAVPMGPRSIQQAPFRVLVGANMPAVLVEMGYLTNPDQEAKLASPAFQSRVVQALVQAVGRFFAGEVPPAPSAQAAGVERQ